MRWADLPPTAPPTAPAIPGGVAHLRRGEEGWPAGLDHLDLPPSALWLLGPHRPGAAPAVAVVGARDASHGGLEVARRLAGDLATAGITVLSGMALGVDGAAHQGALDAGGITVGVLGCGIDVVYPLRHRELRRRVVATGLLLTEEPPGTHPAPWRFPRRNRLIAALADAVVVVEASDRSGALSTARHAADLGREVFAVPGSVLSDRSAGANRLLRDGAIPLTETEDLAAVPRLAPLLQAVRGRLRFSRPLPARLDRFDRRPSATPPSGPAAAILRIVGHDPVHPDAVGEALHLLPPSLAVHLAELELAGFIRTLDGGLVVRDAGGSSWPRRPKGAPPAVDAAPGTAAHTARTHPPTEGD